MTLVPVWRSAAGTAAPDEAAWTNVWKGLDLENALTPIKLQPLLEGASAPTINALAAGDGNAPCARSPAQYNSEYVLIVLAEPDPTAERLSVTLAGTDAVGAITLKRPYRIDAADPAIPASWRPSSLSRVLEGRWKAIKSAGRCWAARAPWQRRGYGSADRGRIPRHGRVAGHQPQAGATPGVEELDVAGLSARGARVTLRYAGGAQQLADELARQGLEFAQCGRKLGAFSAIGPRRGPRRQVRSGG